MSGTMSSLSVLPVWHYWPRAGRLQTAHRALRQLNLADGIPPRAGQAAHPATLLAHFRLALCCTFSSLRSRPKRGHRLQPMDSNAFDSKEQGLFLGPMAYTGIL